MATCVYSQRPAHHLTRPDPHTSHDGTRCPWRRRPCSPMCAPSHWLLAGFERSAHVTSVAPGSCPGGRRRSRCCTCLAMAHGRFDSCSEHTHARSHACTSLLLLHARLGTTGCSIDRLFDRPLLHPHSYSCSLASSLLPSGGWGWMVVGRQAGKHGGMCGARGGLCCALTRRPRASPARPRVSLSLSLSLSPLPSFLCVPGERRQASRSVASSKHAAAKQSSSHDAGNSGREQQPPLEVGTPPRRAMQMRLLWGGVFVLNRGICCFLALLRFGALAPPRPLSQSN